jgi:hypothetical protein
MAAAHQVARPPLLPVAPPGLLEAGALLMGREGRDGEGVVNTCREIRSRGVVSCDESIGSGKSYIRLTSRTNRGHQLCVASTTHSNSSRQGDPLVIFIFFLLTPVVLLASSSSCYYVAIFFVVEVKI